MQDKDFDVNTKNIEQLFKTDKDQFKIFNKILLIIFNDLEKIKNKQNDCLILTDVKKTKSLDYSRCISIVENTFQELNRNANTSMSIMSMIIKLKQILTIF